MQKSVIFFKQSLPEKVVTLLVSIANEAFNNREGQITGIRESSHCLSFGGDENLYGCLQLGMLELEDNKEFLKCVRYPHHFCRGYHTTRAACGGFH